MPMRSGLYKVHFQTQIGSGAGVAVLDDGRLLGGDSSMSYIGSYTEKDGTLTAHVRVDVHTEGLPSVLGINRANLELRGRIQGDSITMDGSAAEASGVSFQAILAWLSD